MFTIDILEWAMGAYAGRHHCISELALKMADKVNELCAAEHNRLFADGGGYYDAEAVASIQEDPVEWQRRG